MYIPNRVCLPESGEYLASLKRKIKKEEAILVIGRKLIELIRCRFG